MRYEFKTMPKLKLNWNQVEAMKQKFEKIWIFPQFSLKLLKYVKIYPNLSSDAD